MFHFRSFACIAVLSMTPLAPAQQADTRSVDAGGGKLISIDFPGGTAAEYLEAVRAASRDAYNLVIAKEAAEVLVPPIQLRQVSAYSAVEVIAERRSRSEDRSVELGVRSVPQRVAMERPTIIIDAVVHGRTDVKNAAVWSLGHLLDEDLTSDDVISVIEVGLLMMDAEKTVDVRFHAPTQLIIARGDMRDLHIVGEVLDRLEEAKAQRDVLKSNQRRLNQGAMRDALAENQVARQESEQQADRLESEVRGLRLELETQLVRAEELTRRLEEQHKIIAELRKRWGD